MRKLASSFFSVLLLSLNSACAPASEPVTLRPTTIEEFVQRLESDLEAHEWQSILAAVDPTLYRARVVEARASEPTFVAETLGIGAAPNQIQEGEELGWDDFDRITTAELTAPSRQNAPYLITGTLMLEGGKVLQVRAYATQVQGRFVLTTSSS